MTSALDLLMDSDSTAETTTLLKSNGICTIDSRTRTIFVPPEIIVGAVQSDKNAERIKFSCPKIVGDNLDLSKFSIRINFENVSSVDPDISIKDQYICEDASINEDNITFSWVIGKNAARYMGTIRFIVCAVKTDSDSNISIEWNTTVAQIPVLEGIEVDQPSLDENNKDVINQLLAITKTASDEAVKNVNSAKEQAITDIQNVLQPDKTLTVEGGIADAKATGNAISSLSEDLTNTESRLSESIAEISNLEKKTDNALSMPTEWELGSIQPDGSFSNSDTRYRTKSKSHFSDGTVFKVETGYKYCLIGYYDDSSDVGLYTGWRTADFTLPKSIDTYVLIATTSDDLLRGADYTELKKKFKIISEYIIISNVKKNANMIENIANMNADVKDGNNTATDWELGSIQADGSFTSADKRYRTKRKEPIKAGTTFDIESGYKYAIIAYYEGSSVVNYYSAWMTTPVTLNKDAMVYMLIATATDDVLRNYDFTELKSRLKIAYSIPIVAKINELANKESTIPTYWETYLDGKKALIKDKVRSVGNHGDFFQFFTDYHCTANVGGLNGIVEYLKDKTNVNKVVFGGDILVNHASKQVALDFLDDFASDFCNDTFFPIVGNHEKNPYGGEGANLFDGDVYTALFKHLELNVNVCLEKRMYYFMDNNAQKIRYIFLNTDTKSDGSEFTNDVVQIRWFEDTLKSVKDGWYVVVFTHMFYNTNTDTSANLTETYYSGQCIHKVMNAYNKKATLSLFGKSYDFTNAKGTVCAVITGHVHRDYSEYDESGFPIIGTACDTNQASQNQYNTLVRTTGTVNEHLIDLFFIDTDARTISTIRIGAGEDRSFTF